jgi:CBS domain containing-hemolysin-like protein
MDNPDADPSAMFIKLIILVLLLVMSAFFSSAETAFMSADKFVIRQLIQGGNRKAKRVAKILEDKDAMISAILIGNNIVNIFASSLTTTLVYEVYGNAYVSLATGILTIVVLLCGEIMPKTIAGKYAEKMSMAYAPILYILIKILTPVIWIVNLISAIFMRLLGIETKATDTRVTEDVLKTMLDMSLEDDQIEPEEHEIINNVLEANDFCARDIMVPRANVVGISKDYTYDDVVDVFKKEGYSRLVVLDERNEKVEGILYLKDMMFLPREEFNMEKLLREPYFTFETKKTQDLLTELRRTANSMAVVLDEYGSLAGILTIEDIVEEFVGQIRDEYDADELKQIKKIDDNTYEIYGAVNITDVNEVTGLELESENYNSIGGYIIEKLEDFPKSGDKLTVDGINFEVLSVVDNRIGKISIKIKK